MEPENDESSDFEVLAFTFCAGIAVGIMLCITVMTIFQ